MGKDYIFQTVDKFGRLQEYEVPGDGTIWSAPANSLSCSNISEFQGVVDLCYDGGSGNNRKKNKDYYGIQFDDDNKTIFKYSSNEIIDNSYGISSGRKNTADEVYNLKAPDGYIKESKYLYRKKRSIDYVYAVFKKIKEGPCSKYSVSSTNIDKDCLEHIWNTTGCFTKFNYDDIYKNKTFNTIQNDIKFLTKSYNIDDRKKCYGSCSHYKNTDRNINNECLEQLWFESGCTTKYNNYDLDKERTKLEIINNNQKISNSNNNNNKINCYGPCSIYKNTDKNISINCLKQLWKNNGCTELEYYYDSDYPNKTLLEIKNEYNNYATLIEDKYKKKCYGLSDEDKLILKCSKKTNDEIFNDELCRNKYNINALSNNIKKSYCSINNNYINNDNCLTILDNKILNSLYDNYCIKDNNYNINSDFNKCNNFYNSTLSNINNKDNFDLSLYNYCNNDKNLFNNICSKIKLQTYKDNIFNSKIKYCQNNDNINSDNCKSIVKNNIDKFDKNIVEFCELNDYLNIGNPTCESEYINIINPNNKYIKNSKLKYCKNSNRINNNICLEFAKDQQNINDFDNFIVSHCENGNTIIDDKICNYIYNTTDPTINSNKVISLSKNKIYNENCKKGSKFLTDPSCISYANKNKNQFIESYIEYCNKDKNIISDTCKTFYNDFLKDKSCKKESFCNNNIHINLNLFYLLLIIIISILLCFYDNINYNNLFSINKYK